MKTTEKLKELFELTIEFFVAIFEEFKQMFKKSKQEKEEKSKNEEEIYEYLETIDKLMEIEKRNYPEYFEELWEGFSPYKALKHLYMLVETTQYPEKTKDSIRKDVKELIIAWISGHYKIMNHIWIHLGQVAYRLGIHKMLPITLFDKNEVLIDGLGMYMLYIVCKYNASDKIENKIKIDLKKSSYTSSECPYIILHDYDFINIYLAAQAFVAGFDDYLKAYYALGVNMGMESKFMQEVEKDLEFL